MNEIKLSEDINVITAEINSYKQVAGQAIFEIGKRLKHVKENDLAYGEWSKWLESIEVNRSTAHRFIRIYEELESDVDTWQQLSTRVLYEIATLPQEEREKEHTLSNGETKSPDEMTVRELQETKRKLRQAEQQAKQAKRSEEIALGKLEEIEDVEPEVVEKEVIKEVVPDDYYEVKGGYEAAQRLRDSYKEENEQLRKEINELSDEMKNNELTGDEVDSEKKEKEVKLLMLDASKSVLKTKITIDEFLQEVAFTSYRRGAIAASSDGTKNKLREGLDDLKNFINEMEMALDGTIEH